MTAIVDRIDDHPALALSGASLSAVVFDSSGNVLGGGTDSMFAKLQPGTRAFFKVTGGVDSVPFNSAASVGISVIPTYEQVPG
jgi:hypothetical protein